MITEISKICFHGLFKINFKSSNLYLAVAAWLLISMVFVIWDHAHLRVIRFVISDPGIHELTYIIQGLGNWFNVFGLFFISVFWILFFLGVIRLNEIRPFRSALRTLEIKNKNGQMPKIINYQKIDDVRSVLKVSSPGIGPHEWEKKREDLNFEFKKKIDQIRVSKNKKHIEIYLLQNDLSKKVSYFDCEDKLTEPYSFIVGESGAGVVTQSIRSLPHMLMGGATGMGKSTAFKLIIYSLLKSSPPKSLKMTLLDLKKGVEVADFQNFPNVEIAKDEVQAVERLEAIVTEMNKRYEYLEENKYKKIEPARDKKPIWVIAVDEASVLYGTQKSNTAKKKLIDKARDLTNDIAKLGRASGIHLILATQRATKTSIDVATQDNLEGRLCFRAKSVSGSTAILGNKDAVNLPDIPGRAFWSKGSKMLKVQVPFIEENALTEECESLARVFNEKMGKQENSKEQVEEDDVFAYENKQSTHMDKTA